jgi:hypothetical protein
MMSDVAHNAMASHFWANSALFAVALYCIVSASLTYSHIFGGSFKHLGERMKQRASLCLKRTGFIGGVLTRHTLLVTMNVLVFNVALNFHSTLRGMDDGTSAVARLLLGSEVLAGVCLVLILIIAVITFILCGEVVRQGENGQ